MPILPDVKIRQLRVDLLSPPWLPPRPPLLTPRSMVIVSFSVVNVGRGLSKQIKPGVYVNAINPNPPLGQNTVVIQKSFPLPSLAPGTEHHFDVPFKGTELKRKGVKRFDVVADPKHLLPETDESNNTATIGA